MSSIMRARNALPGRGEEAEVIGGPLRAEGCWTFNARDQMPRSSPLTAHPLTATAKNAPASTPPSRESGFVPCPSTDLAGGNEQRRGRGGAQSSQTAFLNEPLPDRRDVRFAIAKRVRRRVDRIVTGDEIVLVRSCRAENELGVGQRFEFDRIARRLEGREVPVPQFVRRGQDARSYGDPENGVIRRGLVAPALAGFQSYREIIDRRGGHDGVRCGAVAAEEDAHRTVLRHSF